MGHFTKVKALLLPNRLLDASVTTQGKRTPINPENWKNQDSTITYLPFKAGEAGTYVVGISTKANSLKQTAEEFNDYLKT